MSAGRAGDLDLVHRGVSAGVGGPKNRPHPLGINARAHVRTVPGDVTCLWAAARWGHVEVVRLLLAAKADLRHDWDQANRTPLHIGEIDL